MKNRVIKLTGALLFGGLLLGSVAGGKTKMVSTIYDFGVLRETDGNVTGQAYVVNLGPDTTYVRDVRPSCGCTGARFSTDPIAPGDTAVVSFTYNPVGRPGTISKTVKIYMGDKDERHIVRLSGRVVGSRETLLARYPAESGRLMLSDTVINIGDIEEHSGRHAFVRIINASVDTVKAEAISPAEALQIDLTPPKILPGDLSTLGVYLNTKFTDTLGIVEYPIQFRDRADSAYVTVKVKANILPAPPKED